MGSDDIVEFTERLYFYDEELPSMDEPWMH